MTTRAYGYLRVSTGEQAESGLGLAAQRKAIEDHAKRAGFELVALHEDAGVSGSTTAEERVGLACALSAIRRGDVLLVSKRDRLGRDVVNLAMVERLVERKGGRVVSAAGEGTDSAAGDPTGQLMRRIVDAFAEYERLLIGARTKAALKAKRARGERAGTVPFGYTADASGRLVAIPQEQAALDLMRERRAAGATLRAIVAELERRGFRTRGGGRWFPQTVRSALAHASTPAA